MPFLEVQCKKRASTVLQAQSRVRQLAHARTSRCLVPESRQPRLSSKRSLLAICSPISQTSSASLGGKSIPSSSAGRCITHEFRFVGTTNPCTYVHVPSAEYAALRLPAPVCAISTRTPSLGHGAAHHAHLGVQRRNGASRRDRGPCQLLRLKRPVQPPSLTSASKRSARREAAGTCVGQRRSRSSLPREIPRSRTQLPRLATTTARHPQRSLSVYSTRPRLCPWS